MGRKTGYKPEYDEQAKELALLGATDKIIAEFFQVDEATITRWKQKYESFRMSIRKGKLIADTKVAGALFKKATGFTEKVEEPFFSKGETSIQKYNKFFPPDTAAIRLWLLNRQPKIWRDKQVIEFEKMSESELDEIINRLIGKKDDKI